MVLISNQFATSPSFMEDTWRKLMGGFSRKGGVDGPNGYDSSLIVYPSV
jgi:hypothetical protein